MASSKWKRNERVAARMLGTERIPSNGKPQPDYIIEGFSIESKERKSLPALFKSAMAQAERNKVEGTAPMLVMQEARGPGFPVQRYAVIPMQAFVDLHAKAYPKPSVAPPEEEV
jgi:hypothetical protein